jgi:iron complex transport system permease protein
MTATKADKRPPEKADSRAGGRGVARPRIRGRLLLLLAGGVAVFVVLLLVALTSGEIRLPASVALPALFGLGDRGDVLVVQQFRAPRIAAVIVAGAGLGVAGSVLQRLFRNPLASPDVLGVTGGASFGAVALLAAGASQSLLPVGALGGGLLAAVLLGVFAYRSGLAVTRLVLTGLAVQAGLAAAVNFLIVRFPAELAGSALQWTTGSAYGRTWTEVWGAAGGMVPALAATFGLHRRLAVLDLGDASAGALGVPTSAARVQLLICAVALTSLAAALTGPVSFVALAVPHIVRFAAGPPTAGTMALTGLAGAVLLLAADLTVQHLLPVDGLPAGAVTATLGAPWLLVLMLRQARPVPRSRV